MSRLFNTAVTYNLVAKKINLQIMAINNIFTNLTLPLYLDCGDKILYTFDSDSKLIQISQSHPALIPSLRILDLKAK